MGAFTAALQPGQQFTVGDGQDTAALQTPKAMIGRFASVGAEVNKGDLLITLVLHLQVVPLQLSMLIRSPDLVLDYHGAVAVLDQNVDVGGLATYFGDLGVEISEFEDRRHEIGEVLPLGIRRFAMVEQGGQEARVEVDLISRTSEHREHVESFRTGSGVFFVEPGSTSEKHLVFVERTCHRDSHETTARPRRSANPVARDVTRCTAASTACSCASTVTRRLARVTAV